MSELHGPLQGVKVVACSTAQAGTVPYMLMADLGAEVTKIEVPEGGDNSRGSTVLPGLPSTYFETNNRGVKSVTLNLKTQQGREILHKLVARAEIFGQNFRPGAAEKNGFGYEELRTVNPRLVYISISGYGPKGPHADLPGTDSMAQALGGIAEAYSTPGVPLRTGIVSVADETCAILAFGGALAALTHARATGIGQKVDCSLLGGQIRLMGWTLTTAMWRNRDPVTGIAAANFELRHYDHAVRSYQRALAGQPKAVWINCFRAPAFELAGKNDNAKQSLSALGRVLPDLTINHVRKGLPHTSLFLDRVAEGLETLGMPVS
jgi:crotonobetainyl-CoA:carnitine CoA-transferase CaiB-like acyl-CoA transferase